MGHFTLPLDSLGGGPVLTVRIGVSGERMVALDALKQLIPPAQQVRALVDTGAFMTCVDPTLLDALGLQPTGTQTVHGVTSPQVGEQRLTYDIGLMIPGPAGSSLVRRTIPVIRSEHLVAKWNLGALIGRDVLQQCVLVYNGHERTFTLAF